MSHPLALESTNGHSMALCYDSNNGNVPLWSFIRGTPNTYISFTAVHPCTQNLKGIFNKKRHAQL